MDWDGDSDWDVVVGDRDGTLAYFERVADGSLPTPATHAISTLLKAGESVFQPFLLTKTVSHALRGAQPVLHALLGVKILSGTLFAPPLMNAGYGAR